MFLRLCGDLSNGSILKMTDNDKELRDRIIILWRCGEVSWDLLKIMEELLDRIEKLEEQR
ncbi:hypothetical protein UFOVP816_39 [uncultured Caudovirales phage]|uniref:Uncharacterized protein n=1 Tax=uncultured Caudovirales phage TaxID=2100421 RepID=A0A6J5P3E9_9CAUD|nr:hypothetical protein UFOVP816_39 [uncultured Caudovirales phage]